MKDYNHIASYFSSFFNSCNVNHEELLKVLYNENDQNYISSSHGFLINKIEEEKSFRYVTLNSNQ